MSDRAVRGFLEGPMCKAGRPVPARLHAALAFLERMRHHQSLDLNDHLTDGRQSIVGQETHGKSACERLGIPVLVKTHGRRSSNIQEWGPALLKLIESQGFRAGNPASRLEVLDRLQHSIAVELKRISETEPIRAVLRNRSPAAVVREILDQAEDRNLAGHVAQYLVGAKLLLRFPEHEASLPAHGTNRGDDASGRRGDFDIGDSVFEVAMGLPDEKHLTQAIDRIDDYGVNFWLLVREDRWAAWRTELLRAGANTRLLSVVSVEVFVGQNIAELGALSHDGQLDQLKKLLALYNQRWAGPLGPPGLIIETSH